MDILSYPPTTLHPFTPDPGSGSVVPPSTFSAPIPTHQSGKVPSTGFSIPGLPFPSFPPYGYGMPFPPIPPGVPGTSMTNSYCGGPSQVPMLYHPAMGYYYPPSYGQQPPPPMQ